MKGTIPHERHVVRSSGIDLGAELRTSLCGRCLLYLFLGWVSTLRPPRKHNRVIGLFVRFPSAVLFPNQSKWIYVSVCVAITFLLTVCLPWEILNLMIPFQCFSVWAGLIAYKAGLKRNLNPKWFKGLRWWLIFCNG